LHSASAAATMSSVMWDRRGRRYRPEIDALLAAGLFGMSAPLAKLLLGAVDPVPLAALLYLGAGFGLAFYALLARDAADEAGLGRGDLPWLAGAVLSGGVAAPILLLYGLRTTPAATAALLLNSELVATGVIAAVVFREFIGGWVWGAILMVAAGSALLTLDPSAGWGIERGAVFIVIACAMWGLDNNLTRRISLKDPKRIVAVKGLAAGGVSTALAFALGRPFPGGREVVLGLLLGGVSYGISILLFVRALRHLGAARTGALFGTAPFIGGAVSLMIFRDLPAGSFLLSLPLLVVGTGLLFRERHVHEHAHVRLTHAHAHTHTDGHHDHAHGDRALPALRHSHLHTHEPMMHTHPHRPDVHHRHRHVPAGEWPR